VYRLPPRQRTSFRILRRQVADAVLLDRRVNPVLGPLILRAAGQVGYVQVRHHPRTRGKSGYTYRRLFGIALNGVFGDSAIPIRAVSALGLACMSASLVLGVWWGVPDRRLQITAPGIMALGLLIVFVGGMILLALGILGEYLLRITEEIRRSPRYFVRSMVGGPVADAASLPPGHQDFRTLL